MSRRRACAVDEYGVTDGVQNVDPPEAHTFRWDRKLQNEELSDLYSSPNIIQVIKSRRMRWTGHVARMGERRGAYRVWWGKPKGKRKRRRPRRRWEGNIKMDLQEVGCECMDWIELA